MKELRDQTSMPVLTIDILKPLPRSKLNWFHKRITRKVKREANQFIQGNKPMLPHMNSLACITLGCFSDKMGDLETAQVCFELKSLYIKGVIVKERFYELRKSNSMVRLVEDSISLECGETYLNMFGKENPTLVLSGKAISDAYWRFMDLAPDADQDIFNEAARCLGMISLILIEPSRQNDVKDMLCSGNQTATEYHTMDGACWETIRLWDDRSKIAKGIEYEKDKTVEEKNS